MKDAPKDLLMLLAARIEALLEEVRRELKNVPGWFYIGEVMKNVGENSAFLGSWRTLEAIKAARRVMASSDFAGTLVSEVAFALVAGDKPRSRDGKYTESIGVVTPYVGRFMLENRELAAECVLAGPGRERKIT